MVLRAVCVLLALATLVQGDGHDELCSRVAFQPLAKTLTCGTGCTSDNVSIVWTLKVDDRFHPALATFRYGQPHNISIGVFQYKNVRVSMDGKLEIGLVSTEAHKGQYNCTAYDVSGRQCGITDSFDLNVASLFQDLSVQPVIVSDVVRKTAYYGSRNVLCFNGQSPGIALSETYWKKDGVLNENVVNVSSECPGCVSCEEEDITRYLSLPSVKNRTMSYKYSAFVISVPFYKDTNSHLDYSECVTISNNYVTFLVINNVRAEDDGWFQVSIRSKNNPQPATGKTGIRAEYKKIQSVVDDSLGDMTISSGEKGYVVCSATTTADLNDALHWEFLNSPKSVLAIDSVVVADISEPIPSNISISDEVLDDLCSKYAGMLGAEYVAFSINYANETLLLPRANDHALVQRHFLVLVVCDAGSEQTGTYSCVAPMNDVSDREERNMDLVVEGRRNNIYATSDLTGIIQASVKYCKGYAYLSCQFRDEPESWGCEFEFTINEEEKLIKLNRTQAEMGYLANQYQPVAGSQVVVYDVLPDGSQSDEHIIPSITFDPDDCPDDVHDGCQANTTDKRRDQSSDECADECSELTVAVVITAVLGPLLGALIGVLLTILAHKFCCKNAPATHLSSKPTGYSEMASASSPVTKETFIMSEKAASSETQN